MRDPRIDTQSESRAGYLAGLIHALDAEIEPVVEAAVQGSWLCVDVLAELAGAQHPVALELLTHPDAHPEIAAEMLVYLRDFPGWQEGLSLPDRAFALLAESLHEREDLVYDVEVAAEFWHPWRARLPLVEQAFIDAAAAAAAEAMLAPKPAQSPGAWSTAELLAEVELHSAAELLAELKRRSAEGDRTAFADAVQHSGSPQGIRAAARALADLGDLRLLVLAEELFSLPDDLDDLEPDERARLDSRRAALLVYVAELPASATLPLARGWWPRGGFFRIAAGRVLAAHAEPRDRAWLEAALRSILPHATGVEWVSEIDALARIGDAGSVPLLREVAQRAAYSWARVRALKALVALGAEGAEVDEALWDCEHDARVLACLHGRLDPRSRRRLRGLTAARIEEDAVRRAAAARILADAEQTPRASPD